jgi:hypothetical protein
MFRSRCSTPTPYRHRSAFWAQCGTREVDLPQAGGTTTLQVVAGARAGAFRSIARAMFELIGASSLLGGGGAVARGAIDAALPLEQVRLALIGVG